MKTIACLAISALALSSLGAFASCSPPPPPQEDAGLRSSSTGDIMPAVTVTAVSTSLDTLTATAHGLVTGDRFRLRNINGALPASTPSLAGVTDYFAVRVDADNVKVATSSANALAGTPVVVDLTGAGSGTTTIEYGLPYTIPNAVYVNGVSQVQDKDLNTTFNALVAIYDLLTGQSQSVWSQVNFAVPMGPFSLNVISPSLSSGNNNNFNPAGLGRAGIIMANASAGAAITGLAGGTTGRVIHIINVSGSTITIPDEDSNSSAGNQFKTPGFVTLSLTASQSFSTSWFYDGLFWRLISKTF